MCASKSSGAALSSDVVLNVNTTNHDFTSYS
jgi:hypothetical protein